ncbi:MAG TPA: AMP-binding protein [Microthrixaceae bacterium]|nr:AMP-binding protein [Microthrixaceae bacterium]
MALHPAGEHLAARAAMHPDQPAVVMAGSGTVRTYAELDAAATRLALVLRDRGLRTGDRLAVLVENGPSFFEVVWAAMRTGLHVVPVNWHLRAEEAGFIVADSGARALVVSAQLGEVVAALAPDDLAGLDHRWSVGGVVDGFEPLDEVLADAAVGEVPDEHEGGWMFYSSGTTGRPKGIVPPLPPAPLGAPSFLTAMLGGLFGFGDDTVYLNPAPLYHAAPAGWTTGTHRLGGTVVVMERFDPRGLLAAVERHRVTHVQLVPTHMVRLLELPAAERDRHDLSSLRCVVHAAAPCPPEVKRAFMDWVGPVVHEYYSGSEGVGFCCIGPEEWLAHPGSVGRSLGGAIHVLGPDGEELPPGEEGEVWFETTRTFEYHNDPDATAAAFDERGWSWLGDLGRVDEDGYLYLTDRAGNLIISGGVNISPRESEDVLIGHPAVADVAVVGTPDPEMGERVTAFVQPAPGAVVSGDELVAWCRERLSHYKCPSEVRFVDELPRLPTGKLLKRLLST